MMKKSVSRQHCNFLLQLDRAGNYSYMQYRWESLILDYSAT